MKKSRKGRMGLDFKKELQLKELRMIIKVLKKYERGGEELLKAILKRNNIESLDELSSEKLTKELDRLYEEH